MKGTEIDRAVDADTHRRHAGVVLVVEFIVLMLVLMIVGVMLVLGADLHQFLG